MEPIALLNGQILPQSQATLGLNDAGFVFGATVTDLCRTFRLTLYGWPQHLARFHRSSEAAYIPIPYSDEQITAWANRCFGRAQNAAGGELILVLLRDARTDRLLPSGKPGEAAGDQPPTFGMHTFPLPFAALSRASSNTERRLVVPWMRHVPPACVDARIKQVASRIHWWLADREARRIQGDAQALLFDSARQLTETAAANFLIVREGVVISPPREVILGGISLGFVEELCRRLQIAMEFGQIVLDDALNADEAMLASTPYCLAGVHSIQQPGANTVARAGDATVDRGVERGGRRGHPRADPGEPSPVRGRVTAGALPLTRKRVEKLAHRRHAMIARRREHRRTERNRLQIIEPTNLRLAAIFDRRTRSWAMVPTKASGNHTSFQRGDSQ